MKILQINTVYAEGSTGKIAKDIHDICIENGEECISAYRCDFNGKKNYEDTVIISSKIDSRVHGKLSRMTMFKGCFSIIKTAKFIKKIKKYSPDIIHIHNLHGSYINISLLFRYIKKENIPVVWTLHDCWPFTAICSHFSLIGCKKWQEGCNHCSQAKQLSSSPFDFTKYVWKLKRNWFTGIEKSIVVTPSNWLKKLVNQSFLKEYDVCTIYNGIDLDIFKPIESNFREDNELENKKVVLGVAYKWSYSKGLDVFLKLSELLPEDYKIVLVGTDESIDDKLPKNILSIHKTENQQKLAEIYSSVDVFVNATREEVLGLVNIEALACGTPVITFDTGGSPECIDDTCGVVVEQNDIETLKKEIIRICSENPYSKTDCRNRALLFDNKKQIEKYIKLYRNIIDSFDDTVK